MEMHGCSGEITPSRPRLQAQTKQLAGLLLEYSARKLQLLMAISPKLAEQNVLRWQNFNMRSNPRKPSAFFFRGDVYQGFEAWTLDRKALAWAQDHVRILSGLFGLLRPLDSIQPYRLEMSTPLKTTSGKNLYAFWGNAITEVLRKDICSQHADAIVNLASDEYSRVLDMDALDVAIIQVRFLQVDKAKTAIYASQAVTQKPLEGRVASAMASPAVCPRIRRDKM